MFREINNNLLWRGSIHKTMPTPNGHWTMDNMNIREDNSLMILFFHSGANTFMGEHLQRHIPLLWGHQIMVVFGRICFFQRDIWAQFLPIQDEFFCISREICFRNEALDFCILFGAHIAQVDFQQSLLKFSRTNAGFYLHILTIPDWQSCRKLLLAWLWAHCGGEKSE